MAVYRVSCPCGGFAVATLSEYEARKFATFHDQWNADIKRGQEKAHQARITALTNETRPAQAILEAYATWATAVPA